MDTMKIEVELQVEKVLVLSTAHLCDEAFELLSTCHPWRGEEQHTARLPWTIPNEYGWSLYVDEQWANPDPEQQPYVEAPPDSVIAALVFAHKYGFDWIRFDGDNRALQVPLRVYRYS